MMACADAVEQVAQSDSGQVEPVIQDELVIRARRVVVVRNAVDRLRDPLLVHWTVTEIALRRGFKDAARFSRAFHTRYDVSPTAWRRVG